MLDASVPVGKFLSLIFGRMFTLLDISIQCKIPKMILSVKQHATFIYTAKIAFLISLQINHLLLTLWNWKSQHSNVILWPCRALWCSTSTSYNFQYMCTQMHAMTYCWRSILLVIFSFFTSWSCSWSCHNSQFAADCHMRENHPFIYYSFNHRVEQAQIFACITEFLIVQAFRVRTCIPQEIPLATSC